MDQKLLLLINREWTSPALDRLMVAMSSADLWAPLLILAVFAVMLRGGFHARACLLAALACVGLMDGVVAHELKPIVNRPRPHQALFGVRQLDFAPAHPRLLALGKPLKIKLSAPSEEIVAGRSFPSGHTGNNVAGALVVALFYPRRGWLGFIVPALVGYSRIYTGAHYPSDVLASAFLSAGVTLLVVLAAEGLWRRHGGRLLPEMHTRHPSLLAAS